MNLKHLKELRQSLGLTQADVSRLSRVSLPLIQKLEYEEANPSWKTLEKIGNVLGFDITLSPKKADWNLLISAGVPLHGYKEFNGKITLPALVMHVKNAWGQDNLDPRHREAIAAFVLAIKRHYPSVWRRYFHSIDYDDIPDVQAGRLLKLSEMALDKLARIL